MHHHWSWTTSHNCRMERGIGATTTMATEKSTRKNRGKLDLLTSLRARTATDSESKGRRTWRHQLKNMISIRSQSLRKQPKVLLYTYIHTLGVEEVEVATVPVTNPTGQQISPWKKPPWWEKRPNERTTTISSSSSSSASPATWNTQVLLASNTTATRTTTTSTSITPTRRHCGGDGGGGGGSDAS